MISLNEFAERISILEKNLLELTWVGGRNPKSPWDGGHFALPGTERPLSVSRTEARFLANLVVLTRASSILELGTGFGYSALWLAYGASVVKGGQVYTVDDWSEGTSEATHFEIAKALWSGVGLDGLIHSVHGTSPEVFNGQFPEFDFVFIDGEHRDDQPRHDYEAIKKHLSSEGVIVFHDAQEKYDVKNAIAAARSDGFQILNVPTSCEPVVAFRSQATASAAVIALELAKDDLLVGSARWTHLS